MKDYIDSKIKDIEMKTNPGYYLQSISGMDSDLKRHWKDEQNNKDAKWRKINTNQDIYELIDRFDGAVNFVEKYVKVGHIEDGYNMMLGLYNALQGLRKLAQCTDLIGKPWSNTGFTEVTTEEVDMIFTRINEIISRMENQNMRRMMQD